jgi:hypothetical protein
MLSRITSQMRRGSAGRLSHDVIESLTHERFGGNAFGLLPEAEAARRGHYRLDPAPTHRWLSAPVYNNRIPTGFVVGVPSARRGYALYNSF